VIAQDFSTRDVTRLDPRNRCRDRPVGHVLGVDRQDE
jgi:hypothetical protein